MLDPRDRRRAERALDGALSRLDADERNTVDPDDLYAVVGEALGWLIALDKWHLIETPGYAAARAADPDGQLLVGLKYARNRVQHGLRAMLGVSGGFGFPMRFPLKFSEFVWHNIPRYPEDKSHPDQRRGYDELLVGEMARTTLRRGRDFLFRQP